MKPLVYALSAAVLLFALLLGVFFFVLQDDSEDKRVESGSETPIAAASSPAMPTDAPPGGIRDPLRGEHSRAPGGVGSTSPRTPRGAEPDAENPEEEKGPPELPTGSAEVVLEAVGDDDKPLDGLSVTLRGGISEETIVTRRDGLAVFSGIAPGSYSFRLEAEGVPELVAAKEVSVAAGETRAVTIRIGGFDLSIVGRVLDSGGKAVPGIVVRGRKQVFEAQEGDFLPADQGVLRALSGPDGVYTLEGLEATDYLLRTEATEEYPAARKIFRAGAESADLVLEVTRELQVYGVVTGPGGKPLDGVLIRPVGQASRQARTDRDGSYSLFLATGGDKTAYTLKSRREGFQEAKINLLATDIGESESWQVDVRLEPLQATAYVRGIILDSEGQPVPRETVTMYSAELNGRHRATSNAHGTFEIGEVQVGTYRVWVYPRKGYKDFAMDSIQVSEDGLDLSVDLEAIPTGSFSGRLVDPTGRQIPGFKLWVRSMNALGNSMQVISDTAGRIELDNVPGGDLIFETRSFPRLAVRGVPFDPDARSSDYTLVLDWGEASFSGRVTNDRGEPVGGANVTLSWSAKGEHGQSSALRSAVTDDSGVFALDGLSAVEHKLSVTASGYRTQQLSYRVGSGQHEVQVRLQPRD